MTTIYLSSTYEDLKDYRSAVFEALRKAGYEVKAMEDYVATDRRPVDKCLADVAEADIYVGLFAFRYDYVPPAEHGNPDGFSITELEFRHAEKLGKPCLVFTMNEDTPLPSKFIEKSEPINRLRDYLLKEKTVSLFSSPYELASLVQAAVTKLLSAPERSIGDTIIDQVRRYLHEQLRVPPSSQGRPSLTPVLMELRGLFSRIAFAQPIKQSADKDWATRFCVLCQTLDVLEEYRTAVHGQTTPEELPLLISYDAIIADLQEYVMAMTAFFDPRLLFVDARNECRDDVNKFRSRVRPTALPQKAIDDAELKEAEQQRIKIVRELRKWPGSTSKRTPK
jgi:hypothetical protein